MTKRHLLLLSTFLVVGAARAQRLPNVQTSGLRAPDKIKIDGKASEWGSQFKAYNKTTRIYYTLANDDDRLYLAIQMRDDDIAQKVIRGGITLIVDASGSNTGKANPAITFPVYDKMDSPKVPAFKYSFRPSATPAQNNLYLDSLAKVRNLQLDNWVKTIGLSNLKGLSEPEISLYNDLGISGAIRFESNLYCNYEVAIPLKYLGLTTLGPTNFVYRIKLNGAAVNGTNISDLREGIFFGWHLANGKSWSEHINADQVFPTDFWGEYTLIMK